MMPAPLPADEAEQWFRSHYGLAVSQTPRDIAFCAHAILTPDEPLVVPDATRDARFADNPLVASDPNIRFYAGVPLVNPQRYALGTLCVVDFKPREITNYERECLIRLGETVSTTMELQRAMNRIRRLALTDALTGIGNRPAFFNALDRAIALQRVSDETIALAYLDLDGFKQVNDRHGHSTGDLVLQQAALVLAGNLRGEDVVARLGGDEFGVVLTGRRLDGRAIGERLRSSIGEAMAAGGWIVTASVGVVTFEVPPDSVAAAVAAADAMMYAAKNSGKNKVCYRSFSRE